METYKEFCKPGQTWVEPGQGGLPLLHIHNGYADCEVFLHGAHVARFQPKGQPDVLWMSPYSVYGEGKPIRGGIPVCFPWFGPHRTRPELPQHGFARLRIWELVSIGYLPNGKTQVVLSLDDDEGTLSAWPYHFHAEMRITVGADLTMALLVRNTGKEEFSCEEAFHTYFSVSSPLACEIQGLDGVGYIDRTHNDARKTQSGPLRVTCEMVKAFMGAPVSCQLVDDQASGTRRIKVEQEGMGAMVVWNPWEAAAQRNPEILEGWQQYVCIESANVLDCPIVFLPGDSHLSTMRLSYV